MLNLSADHETAEQELEAVLFFLAAFGYIDGDFDDSERDFVRRTLRSTLEHRVHEAMAPSDATAQEETAERWTAHFLGVFDAIDREMGDLLTEEIARDESRADFIYLRLKQRCFEVLQGFDSEGRDALLDLIDDLVMADGRAHPAEVQFRAELSELLEADLGIELIEEEDEEGRRPTVILPPPARPVPEVGSSPLLDPLERPYPSIWPALERELAWDFERFDRAEALLSEQRRLGAGRLQGRTDVAELADEEPFLDGFVHVLPVRPDRRYELLVLGDLHGCYSCLKAAVETFGLAERIEAFERDPSRHPEPRLVLLGDYVDRGRFSYEGVLRAATELFCRYPAYVILLRGNHEFYVETEEGISSGVRPAEAIDGLSSFAPPHVFARFKRFFEALPNMLLFERMLLVHGGIPRDATIKERYADLSSLNDPVLRFEMMWSNTGRAEVIPAPLQSRTNRFSFGRQQCQAFLSRLGCHTLIRGHEKVDEGYRVTWPEGPARLVTVFSAGGADNADLPPGSPYRQVDPMALAVSHGGGETRLTPLVIPWAAYNDPAVNGLLRAAGGGG